MQSVFANMQDRLKFETGGLRFRRHIARYALTPTSSLAEFFFRPCWEPVGRLILGDLKTNLAIEMSQNNTLTHGKLYRCQTQRRNTQITAEIMQTYDLLKFALARSNGSSFLLITQYEMPFINKSEATKRSKDRKIYGKCAINGTNRRSRVWPVYFIYINTS